MSADFWGLRNSIERLVDASKALDVSIRQRVATDSGQDAPETIRFHVPVYDIREARGDQYDVEVYVEYDYEKKCFVLLTVHSDLRAARESAVAELIDDLKATVPIWKHQLFEDGSDEWVGTP